MNTYNTGGSSTVAQLVPGSWSLVNLQFCKPTCFTLAFSVFSSLLHFFELRCSSLAANLRLNKCSVGLVKEWFMLISVYTSIIMIVTE